MSQEYLNNIRSQIGMGMQDVRNADQRSKDQKYTYSGNPNMPYNYSYDQNMGGQNPSLGRYRPPMMDANGGWQDSGDPLGIAQQSATTSEVLTWTGAAWEPSWGNPFIFVTTGQTITTAVNEILIGYVMAYLFVDVVNPFWDGFTTK